MRLATLSPQGGEGLRRLLLGLDQLAVDQHLGDLDGVERRKLKLHAAYFGVASGDLSIYDPSQKKFIRGAADAHAKAFAKPRF